MIKYIETLNNLDLSKYILNATNKPELLKNEEIRKLLFKEENHYSFVLVIRGLKGEDILNLLDENIIPYLKKNKRKVDKIEEILSLNNPYINYFLINPEITKLINIIQDKTILSYSSINIIFAQKYFEYLIKNNEDLYLFTFFNDEIIEKLLQNEDNTKQISKNKYLKDIIKCLSGNNINYLMPYKKTIEIILDLTPEEIATKIETGLKLPLNILNSSKFLEKFYMLNPNRYRNAMYIFTQSSPYLSEKIENIRKKYIKEFLKTKNYDEAFLMALDFAYKDYPQNTLKNIEFLYNYLRVTNTSLIKQNNFKLYGAILENETISETEIERLINYLLNEENLDQTLYYDLTKAKLDSYQKLNQNLLKKENMQNLFSENLTQKYNIPIYELKGEPFYLAVSCTRIEKKEVQKTKLENNSTTTSISIINQEHLGTFKSPEENVILGFEHLETNRIMHMYEADSYTEKLYGSKVIPRIYTPENLIFRTYDYNEILYKNLLTQNKQDTIKPSYVICYNEIKEGDLSIAKLNNIPIILLQTKYYTQKEPTILYVKNNDNDNEYSGTYFEKTR